MHIAYLADGHNYHVKKWVRAMSEAGVDVTLITLRPPEEPIPGVTIEALPILLGDEKRYSYLNYVLSVSRVRQLLKRLKPDVLLGSYATHYGWVAARTQFRPFVLQTWTFDLTKYPFHGAKRLFFSRVVRYSLKRADLVTTDGAALYERGCALYPEIAEKFESVRWGIRLQDIDISEATRVDARIQHSIPKDATVVTSPRGLQPVYRPADVLSTLLRLLKVDSKVFVVVLTLGHERTAEVDTLIAQLEQNTRAIVVDRFASSEEIASIWQITNFVVSVPEADGISESLLENIYAGSYPVVSDIASNRSLVAEGVRATVVHEPVQNNLFDSLVALIREKEETPKRLEECCASNRQWVLTNANVEQTAEQMKRLFQRVLNQSG